MIAVWFPRATVTGRRNLNDIRRSTSETSCHLKAMQGIRHGTLRSCGWGSYRRRLAEFLKLIPVRHGGEGRGCRIPIAGPMKKPGYYLSEEEYIARLRKGYS